MYGASPLDDISLFVQALAIVNIPEWHAIPASSEFFGVLGLTPRRGTTRTRYNPSHWSKAYLVETATENSRGEGQIGRAGERPPLYRLSDPTPTQRHEETTRLLRS